MSDLGIFEHYPDCDMQFAPLDACNCSTRCIRELEAENNKLKSEVNYQDWQALYEMRAEQIAELQAELRDIKSIALYWRCKKCNSYNQPDYMCRTCGYDPTAQESNV